MALLYEEDLMPFFGNPNIQRQGAKARALAAQRDVNTLPDPRTYAAVSGLLGTAPDQMGFSVLNPQYESIQRTAKPAFALGTLLGLAPITKGLPVGASIKNVGKNIFDDATKYHQKVPEIKSINIDKLKRMNSKEVADVSDEVAANMDFSKPIQVSAFADGELRIVDGHHRVAAAKKRGITSLPVELQAINAKGSTLNKLAQESTYPQQAALDLAQQRAALPVEQGGLGLAAGNTAEQRATAMGFDTPAYHGTTTDIKPTFNLDYSGSNAFDYGQKNIFASSDPQLASDYALKGLSRNQAETIKKKKNYDLYKSKVIPKDMMDAFVKDAVEYGVAEGGGANVLPLLMRGNIFPYEAYGGRFSSEIPKALLGRDLSNADIAAINNVVDNPTLKKVNPSTVYAIKNPENIRSRFAAFDPFRRSAAVAASMGVAAPDLLAAQQDEEMRKLQQLGLLGMVAP
jgi:hypothetical protein